MINATIRLKTTEGLEQYLGPGVEISDSCYAVWALNRSYYSHHTGEVWATMLFEGDDIARRWYTANSSAANERATHYNDYPGSLIVELVDLFILPYDLLVREFHLRTQEYLDGKTRPQFHIRQEGYAPTGEAASEPVSSSYGEESIEAREQDTPEAPSLHALMSFKGIQTAL